METPLYVIQALAEVRDAGSINLNDRDAVTALVSSSRAIEWLDRASNSQYMNALQDMAAAESDNFWPQQPESTSDDDLYPTDEDTDYYSL